MILHLIRLIWNRKWTNLRIMAQITLSFIAVFAVTVWAVRYYVNYQQPLGFTYENIWQIQITPNNNLKDGTPLKDNMDIFNRFLTALREFDEIEDAGVMSRSPYLTWEWLGTSALTWKGRKIDGIQLYASSEIANVLDLKLLKGRWFNREDAGEDNLLPVVINSYLEKKYFKGKDALGENFPDSNHRVIGVIEQFRPKGELSDPVGCIFHSFENNPSIKSYGNFTQRILFKIKPDKKAPFEEKILPRLGKESRGWMFFDFRPLTEMRDKINRPRLISVFIGAIIAGFLLIMVALGLTGVLWLNVTRRTMEIGLRRAKGATKRNIRNQITGELSIITGFGLIIGIIILIPAFPVVVLINLVTAKVYIISIIISAGLVFGISLLSALYPGMLAAGMHPAQALHYE